MSKFVGKFRKDQDYKDDLISKKNAGKQRRNRKEHSEIKRLKSRFFEESGQYERDYDNYR